MSNTLTAPRVKAVGVKMRDKKGWGRAVRPHEMEEIIFQQLTNASQLKIMLFLTGSGDGFRVPLKTIEERLGISKTTYYDQRKALEQRGWITVTNETIFVNYNNIYGEVYKGPPAPEQGEESGNPENEKSEIPELQDESEIPEKIEQSGNPEFKQKSENPENEREVIYRPPHKKEPPQVNKPTKDQMDAAKKLVENLGF